jgi:hypothetical protein
MKKYVYIKIDRDGFTEPDSPLDATANRIGETRTDYENGLWVLLTPAQVAFRDAHPSASKREVFEMTLTAPPVRTLEQAKAEKIMTIDVYDTSDAVNSFEFNGTHTWVPVTERSYLRDAIAALEAKGIPEIEVPLLGQFFPLPVATVKSLLADIEIYAYNASVRTAKHKAGVNGLSTVEEVDAYDYTAGYPEKVTIAL